MSKIYGGLYFDIFSYFSVVEKRKVIKMIVMLPGAGCSYHKNTGGCSMCGFHKATKAYSFGLLYPSILFEKMFSSAIKKANKFKVEEIMIFNGGSFFNEKELPSAFQRYAISKFASDSSATRLIVESRCEYISDDRLAEIKLLIGSKEFSVAIGLESQDDFIRNSLIKKGLSKKLFEKTILSLQALSFSAIAYVFLKPLDVVEKEAYDDCLKTIEYAINVGVKEIYLSSAFVQTDTKMHDAYLSNTFTSPSLWTVLAIISNVVKNGWPVTIGGFTDEPKPISIPESCSLCSEQIYQSIDAFRYTGSLGKIPECSCYEKWLNDFCIST